VDALPAEIILEKGDVLFFNASGGQVTLNTTAVELPGAFSPGIRAAMVAEYRRNVT